MGNLTASAVKAAKEPGSYSDGDGLFLKVSGQGARSWMVRVQKDGRRRDIGLGSAAKVSLADARGRAAVARSQMEAGIDPVAERRKAAGVPTFRELAAIVHGENRAAWRNAKHGAQWLSTLETYAFPTLGDVAVSELTTGDVRNVLAAIWLHKPETARRVRQRIGKVVKVAAGKGYRTEALDWDAINTSLPTGKRTVRHHAALPYSDVPDFLERLRSRTSAGRLALEALVLTAARSGEIRLARWSELDLEAGLWTVPAERMKMGREHVVPLSPAAVDAFTRAKPLLLTNVDLVFPGMKRGRPLSDMTLTKAMRDMGLDATPHGFRSAFKDWAAETTTFPNELSEAALAHAVKDRTEAAYRRGDLLERRRDMMSAWGRFCGGVQSGIVRLAAA